MNNESKKVSHLARAFNKIGEVFKNIVPKTKTSNQEPKSLGETTNQEEFNEFVKSNPHFFLDTSEMRATDTQENKNKPKSMAELIEQKKRTQPFYKDENKKSWE